MAYDGLVERLANTPLALRVAAFPDGSVDSYYRVADGDRLLATRAAFVERVIDGRSALQLTDRQRRPGGQAVNMAQQTAALDDTVQLVGSVSDPIFDSLPFETTSMGAPAEVSVLRFRHEDLLLATRSREAREWEFEQLRTAVDPESFLKADLVCCGNAGVFADIERAAEAVAAAGSGGVLVYDPGEVGGLTAESRRTLVEAMGNFETGFRTVLSANRSEIESIAAALAAETDDQALAVEGDDQALAGKTAQIRDNAGITGVVAHTERSAVAATPDGTVEVPNLDTERVLTVTGAGDRFTAGLGHALASDWSWETALQLGNACASYHVVHGDTAGRGEIADYVQQLETV
jgi:sugar/nucleoside kinase (ribokinase family)